MTLFRWFLAAALILSFAAPATLVADDQKDSDKAASKELELKACGPKDKQVNYNAGTDKGQHPTPEPPADKALVYVLRPSMMGNKVQSKLAVDGDWKGVNRGNNYFYFTLDPGEHYVCSAAENHSLLKLNVEAGKTYYLQQHIRMGVMKARNEVELMSEQEGKTKLGNTHLSTWTIK
jgi:Protein of unknown function (DUF2846)